MPIESPEQICIEFTPEFKRNLRMLAKKHRHIRSDIQPVVIQLQGEKVSCLNYEYNGSRTRRYYGEGNRSGQNHEPA